MLKSSVVKLLIGATLVACCSVAVAQGATAADEFGVRVHCPFPPTPWCEWTRGGAQFWLDRLAACKAAGGDCKMESMYFHYFVKLEKVWCWKPFCGCRDNETAGIDGCGRAPDGYQEGSGFEPEGITLEE